MSFLIGISLVARLMIACLIATVGLLGQAEADELDILKGKTIRVIIGSTAGGAGDTITRAFFKVFEEIVPDASVRIQNVAGSGGAKAVKELQEAGGSVITVASFSNGLIYGQLISPDISPYDLNRLNWIGSLESAQRFLAIRSGLGGSSLDTLRNLGHQPIVPASDKFSSSSVQTHLVSAMFDLRMKVVLGTSDAQQEAMLLAGDIDALVGSAFELVAKIDRGELIPVLKFSNDSPLEQLKGIPTIADAVSADVPKELVFLMETLDKTGRLMAAAPTTDPAIVTALRAAFDRTASNPAYVEAMAKVNVTISPTSGAEVDDRLDKVIGPSSEPVKKAAQAYLACGERMSEGEATRCN
jgi:tripartite-type tricarboxylate transporter receptor subunit TctC